jgi:hypothetical protein
MRWLFISLLISVAGLLVAAAGTVRHILRQRTTPKSQPPEGDAVVIGKPEASDAESES